MNNNLFKSISVSLIILLLTGCKGNSSGPDVSGIDIDVKIHPFFIDLFEMDENDMEEEVRNLHLKYGRYLEAYSQLIIKIGSPDNPEYPNFLKSFLEYEENKDVYAKCKEKYETAEWLEDQVTDAFRHYKYYFPEKEVPEVYLHTSYFNQSIAVDSGWLSVSVEKYLGADCKFYEWLAVPKYLRRKMVPEKVVPDIMKAVAYSEFNISIKNEDVISNIIKEGRVIHFVKAMMPELPDTILFDFSDVQMEWCKQYEGDMWANLVENKHLYNNERLIIQKYVGESPFTYFFGQQSPGKAAVYLGYRIIKQYLKNNPEVSLGELLKEEDAHKILRESRYRP